MGLESRNILLRLRRDFADLEKQKKEKRLRRCHSLQQKIYINAIWLDMSLSTRERPTFVGFCVGKWLLDEILCYVADSMMKNLNNP